MKRKKKTTTTTTKQSATNSSNYPSLQEMSEIHKEVQTHLNNF